MKPLCVVCLFKKNKQAKAVTLVKGYAVCQKHLSYDEDFFRDWEAVQDPKRQPDPTITATATNDTANLD